LGGELLFQFGYKIYAGLAAEAWLTMISTKPKRGNSSGNPRRLMQSMSEAIAWLPASHRIKHSPESLIGSTRAWWHG